MKTLALLPRCVLAVAVASLLVLAAGCQSHPVQPTSPGPHQTTAADAKDRPMTSPGPHQ